LRYTRTESCSAEVLPAARPQLHEPTGRSRLGSHMLRPKGGEPGPGTHAPASTNNTLRPGVLPDGPALLGSEHRLRGVVACADFRGSSEESYRKQNAQAGRPELVILSMIAARMMRIGATGFVCAVGVANGHAPRRGDSRERPTENGPFHTPMIGHRQDRPALALAGEPRRPSGPAPGRHIGAATVRAVSDQSGLVRTIGASRRRTLPVTSTLFRHRQARAPRTCAPTNRFRRTTRIAG